MTIHLATGDVLRVVRSMANDSLDGLLADAPYGRRILNNKWDCGVPSVETWRELHRVLKPGAPALVFGGPNTHHRLMTNMEDAGFELRDCLGWLYGRGFPSSQNISKAIAKMSTKQTAAVNGDGMATRTSEQARPWDGYGTRLKPAWEPIVLAQKPRQGSFAENALEFGVGGLNLKDCWVAAVDKTKFPVGDYGDRGLYGVGQVRQGDVRPDARFPANVLLTHHPDCGNAEGRCHPDCPVGLLDQQAGTQVSRFFYAGRASAKERNLGLGEGETNDHPCVKPVELCSYLARLLLPPERDTPRKILVPFSGSGSEMIGAMLAGWDAVYGIEIDAHYVDIAKKRIRYWREGHGKNHG